MIIHSEGDVLTSPAYALVNPVNTVGTMGAGLALKFKQAYPANFKAYIDACNRGTLRIGALLAFPEMDKLILNVPTKTDWKEPSTIDYIRRAMSNLVYYLVENKTESVAIPALGCGHGKLDYQQVLPIIEEYLEPYKGVAYVYKPKE